MIKLGLQQANFLLLDLTDVVCQRQLLCLVSHPDLFFVQLGPPSGSSCRARDKPLPKSAVDAGLSEPARCRSEVFPEGLPGLADAPLSDKGFFGFVVILRIAIAFVPKWCSMPACERRERLASGVHL